MADRSHYNSLNHHEFTRNFNLFHPDKTFLNSMKDLNTYIVNNCYTDTQNDLYISW